MQQLLHVSILVRKRESSGNIGIDWSCTCSSMCFYLLVSGSFVQSKLVQSGDWDVPNVPNVRSRDISDQICTGSVPKCPHSERLGRSERSNRPIGQFRPVQMNLKLAIRHIEKSCLSSVCAAYDQVRRNAHDRINRQRKVDAGAAAGAQPREGGHVDADQPCAAVQERASAVALADRSIHLHTALEPPLSHGDTGMIPMCSKQHLEAVKQQEHVQNLYGAADYCADRRGDCTVDPTAHQLPMRQVGLSSPSRDRSRSADVYDQAHLTTPALSDLPYPYGEPIANTDCPTLKPPDVPTLQRSCARLTVCFQRSRTDDQCHAIWYRHYCASPDGVQLAGRRVHSEHRQIMVRICVEYHHRILLAALPRHVREADRQQLRSHGSVQIRHC